MRRDPSPPDDGPDVQFVGGAPGPDAEEFLDDGPDRPPRRWLVPVGVLAAVAFAGAALLTRSGDDTAAPSPSPSALARSPGIPDFDVPSAAGWPEGGFGGSPSVMRCRILGRCTSDRPPGGEDRLVQSAVAAHFPGASEIDVNTRVRLGATDGRAVGPGGRVVHARFPNGSVAVLVDRQPIRDADIPAAAGAGSLAVATLRGVHVAVVVSYLATDIPNRLIRAGNALAKDVRLVHGLT